jgi:hypothetical protein
MVLALLKAAFGTNPAVASDRRGSFRVSESGASVIIKSKTYKLLDWSPDGFRLSNYSAPMTPGDRMRIRLMLPHRDINYGFDLNAEIRHVDPRTGEIGVQFLDVDPASLQRLKRIFADRLR